MDGFEQNLHINDSAFEGMRHDADRVLQKLLKNMVDKDSLEGSVTIKIDISLAPEYIANMNPNIEGETRRILTPAFTHKIGSMMQIKDEAKGGINYEGMEMVWDDELKEFVVKPIADTAQRSIFDADFQCCEDVDSEVVYEEEQPTLEGRRISALPGPSAGEGEETEEGVDENAPVDDTEVSDGNEDYSNEIPFTDGYSGVDDEYGYEQPGGEF